MTVDFEIRAELRDLRKYRTVHRDLFQIRTRACDSLSQLLLILGVFLGELFRIAIVRFASLDDLHAVVEIGLRHDFGVQSKTIQQLRPQFAFFGIARSHQHEAGRMFDRHAFPLDAVSSSGGHVQ